MLVIASEDREARSTALPSERRWALQQHLSYKRSWRTGKRPWSGGGKVEAERRRGGDARGAGGKGVEATEARADGAGGKHASENAVTQPRP